MRVVNTTNSKDGDIKHLIEFDNGKSIGITRQTILCAVAQTECSNKCTFCKPEDMSFIKQLHADERSEIIKLFNSQQ